MKEVVKKHDLEDKISIGFFSQAATEIVIGRKSINEHTQYQIKDKTNHFQM